MAGSDQELTALASADAPAGVLVREGDYGEKVITVEPGGAEFIPLHERHGKPLQLFWTWTSPNMEFATIFVGMLAVVVFGLGFWEAALALVLGSAIGGITQQNCGPLVEAGADFLAVIGAIWSCPRGPRAAVAAFNEVFARYGRAHRGS